MSTNAEELDALRAALQMAIDSGDVGTASALARTVRTQLLAECDYTQMVDYAIDDAVQDAWHTYRQALRDVPEQEGFPLAIVWPESPATASETEMTG